jgi:hypothetical protein
VLATQDLTASGSATNSEAGFIQAIALNANPHIVWANLFQKTRRSFNRRSKNVNQPFIAFGNVTRVNMAIPLPCATLEPWSFWRVTNAFFMVCFSCSWCAGLILFYTTRPGTAFFMP